MADGVAVADSVLVLVGSRAGENTMEGVPTTLRRVKVPSWEIRFSQIGHCGLVGGNNKHEQWCVLHINNSVQLRVVWWFSPGNVQYSTGNVPVRKMTAELRKKFKMTAQCVLISSYSLLV